MLAGLKALSLFNARLMLEVVWLHWPLSSIPDHFPILTLVEAMWHLFPFQLAILPLFAEWQQSTNSDQCLYWWSIALLLFSLTILEDVCSTKYRQPICFFLFGPIPTAKVLMAHLQQIFLCFRLDSCLWDALFHLLQLFSRKITFPISSLPIISAFLNPIGCESARWWKEVHFVGTQTG